MLYFMSIKNKKKIKIKIKKEKEKGAYIPIILERAGNYNGIFWYRNILIFYFGITSLSLSILELPLSLSLSLSLLYYILFVLLLYFSQHQNRIGR